MDVSSKNSESDNRYDSNAEHCVGCGELIPEGSQYCAKCTKAINKLGESEDN